MDSVRMTDQMSAEVAKTPNRVSLNDIEANIAAEFYKSGAEFVSGEGAMTITTADSLRVLTVCVLVLKNGFTVIGKAAPADAANFNPELGRKFAREDAIRQCWPIMGYALRERIYHGW